VWRIQEGSLCPSQKEEVTMNSVSGGRLCTEASLAAQWRRLLSLVVLCPPSASSAQQRLPAMPGVNSSHDGRKRRHCRTVPGTASLL
jgi:hypothetical protein